MQPKVAANSVIIVKYKAKVKAVVADHGKPLQNEAWVEYPKDPSSEDGGDPPSKTPGDKVFIFNYTLKGNKIDSIEKTKNLEGAEFVVSNEAKNKFLKRTGSETDYTTTWVNTPEEADKFRSGADGAFSVKGLDAGTYYLKEVTAPAGYKLPDGDKAFFKFTITATTAEKPGGTTASVQNLSLTSGAADTAVSNGSNTVETNIKVENTSFSELPETGGIGTTIFVVTGLVIMGGAAVGLVLRRRSQQA